MADILDIALLRKKSTRRIIRERLRKKEIREARVQMKNSMDNIKVLSVDEITDEMLEKNPFEGLKFEELVRGLHHRHRLKEKVIQFPNKGEMK